MNKKIKIIKRSYIRATKEKKQSELVKEDLKKLLNNLRIDNQKIRLVEKLLVRSKNIKQALNSIFFKLNTIDIENEEEYHDKLKTEVEKQMKKNYDKEIDMINQVYEIQRRYVAKEQDKYDLYDEYILDLEWVKLHYEEQEEINKKIIERLLKKNSYE